MYLCSLGCLRSAVYFGEGKPATINYHDPFSRVRLKRLAFSAESNPLLQTLANAHSRRSSSTELMELGNPQIWGQGNREHIDLNTRLRLILDVIERLYALHQKSILHRDSKPENIRHHDTVRAKLAGMNTLVSEQVIYSNCFYQILGVAETCPTNNRWRQ